jgi:hypothetical protein
VDGSGGQETVRRGGGEEEEEIGLPASAVELELSCAGLIRAFILSRKNSSNGSMDCRVKPGNAKRRRGFVLCRSLTASLLLGLLGH